MTIADIKKTAETKMDQSIAAFKNNLQKSARAVPTLLCWTAFRSSTTAPWCP